MKAITAMLFWCVSAMALAVEPVMIDVRTAQEFSSDHVQGAVNIPYDEVGDKVPAMIEDKSTPINLYCRSGNRAGKAQSTLEKLGYTHVTNLGGLEEARRYKANKQAM